MASLVSSSWLHPPLPHPHRHTGCHPLLKTTWKENPPQRQHRDLCFMAKAKAGAGHSPVPWEPWASHHRPKLNTKMQGKETLHPINQLDCYSFLAGYERLIHVITFFTQHHSSSSTQSPWTFLPSFPCAWIPMRMATLISPTLPHSFHIHPTHHPSHLC